MRVGSPGCFPVKGREGGNRCAVFLLGRQVTEPPVGTPPFVNDQEPEPKAGVWVTSPACMLALVAPPPKRWGRADEQNEPR